MAKPLAYYQNQIFNNSLNAISNTMAQMPVGIFGSLIAYNNIDDWFKIAINNAQTTVNVNINVVDSVNVTGTLDTILEGSTTAVNVAVVDTINTILTGSTVTQNVNMVNIFSIPTVIDTQIVGSNITANVTVVGPIDSSDNVYMDIRASQLSGYVNVNVLDNNITSNVTIINAPNTYLAGSNIAQNVQIIDSVFSITNTANTQIVDSNITQNINIANFSANQNVTVINTPIAITGNVGGSIVGNNTTSNLAITNFSEYKDTRLGTVLNTLVGANANIFANNLTATVFGQVIAKLETNTTAQLNLVFQPVGQTTSDVFTLSTIYSNNVAIPNVWFDYAFNVAQYDSVNYQVNTTATINLFVDQWSA